MLAVAAKISKTTFVPKTRRQIPLLSSVTLAGSIWPDGGGVTGTWTVQGRGPKGLTLFLERHGTVIQVPTRAVRVVRRGQP